jgi:hypothetical protein
MECYFLVSLFFWKESSFMRCWWGGAVPSVSTAELWPCFSKGRFHGCQICIFSMSYVGHAPSSLVRRCLLVQQPLATVVWKICDWRMVTTCLGRLLWLGRTWWPQSVFLVVSGGNRKLLVNICCWVFLAAAHVLHAPSPMAVLYSGSSVWVFLCCSCLFVFSCGNLLYVT